MDRGGLVSIDGASWSLDWWIGADDRWYLPAREASVRQRRLGGGPVIETTVRIPSGDARHTVYGAIVGGRPATVVEVHNDSPVPIALALAIRPFAVGPVPADEPGSPKRRRAAPALRWVDLDGDVVHVDDEHAIVLPRPPAHAGGSVGHDVLDDLLAGRDLAWETTTTKHRVDGSAANSVVLYPVPHRTSIRLLLTASTHDERSALPETADAPDASTVASGWTAVMDADARFGYPDPGMSDAVAAARARIMLEAPNLPAALAGLDPASATALAALAMGGHHREVDRCFAAVAAAFPRRLAPDDQGDGAAGIVDALALAAELTGTTPEPALLESVLQIVQVIERSMGRRPWRRTPSPTPKPAVAVAKRGLARLARLGGDGEGAARLLVELGPDAVPPGRAPQVDVATLDAQRAEGAAAGSWGDDDAEAAARFVIAARSLLIDDETRETDHASSDRDRPTRSSEIVLLPGFAPSWRGGNAEVHRSPTVHGLLSFALRWHGPRPALLWELAPRSAGPEPAESVRLRCPALDPAWSTTEPSGETLLAGSAELLPQAPMPGDSFT